MKQIFKNVKPLAFIIKVCETCKYATADYTDLNCINKKSKYYGENLIECSSCIYWRNDAELISHSKRNFTISKH